MLRRHPVVLKETKNRADTKMSVTVESEFILSLKGKFHSNAPSSFWVDAITRKIKDGRRGHVFRQIGFYFGTCSTTHWGEHFDQICRRTGIFSVLAQPGIEVNTIGMFHLNPSFSCDNKKNQWWSTAAMFVDGPELLLKLAQLGTEGNILTKF